MAEHVPLPYPEKRFGDIDQSRFLQFGNAIQIPGDPERPDDFARAYAYLETITQHCLAHGVWDKQPTDIANELANQNEWHKFEVEQERKAGEKQAEYREINLHQLRALSKRRVLAFEDTGWEVTQAYRVVCFFDKLIEDAVIEQAENEQHMAVSYPENPASFEPPSNSTKETPF